VSAAVGKERLDKLLVDRGLCPSRERAQALILAGQVLVGDVPVDKAGTRVPVNAPLRLRGGDLPYVSRGGLKLAHALDAFALDPRGLTMLDAGASTGGFTDCLLQRGAARVLAVDVGTNQLAWSLRQDPRVVSMEQVNLRDLQLAALPAAPEAAVCDVSFISLTLVLERLRELLGGDGGRGRWLVPLVKPQFEVGRAHIGKGGVVRDPEARLRAVEEVKAFAAAHGFEVQGETGSPITGPAGNVEYLLHLRVS
jgi:23S rRNA (cytidine1920-2'-O)/16S rRNA (cytidine1409-2'-O)-methyltransferase